jgi:hypothetical protein
VNILKSILSRANPSAPVGRWRITGPYQGITGYDRMVRSLVPCLCARGIAIELHEHKNWSPTRMSGSLPRNFSGRVAAPEVHLQFCLPTQAIRSPGCQNFNYTMFEASRIPSAWADAAQKQDLILLPTESSRQSWIAAGVSEKKLRLCPQGADFDLFSPRARPLELRARDGRPAGDFRWRFLNVAEAIYRKNLTGLLRVWLTATNSEDDAVLILKPGFYAPGSRQFFVEEMRRLETERAKTFADAAPIILCDRQLSEAEMPRLYTAATHYWSMSYGEGFDLPMIEAAACDLQLIAPCHSSYRHYLTEQIAFLLEAEEIDASIPNDPGLDAFFRGARWWRPNEAIAGDVLRRIIAGRAPQLASSRNALQFSCTWNIMAERLIREIDSAKECS